jgi:protoporphyrin/coproporphyrin ferrochelatase
VTKPHEGEVPSRVAVLLIAHGTVEGLDDLPAFLTGIRRGHAAPPALVAEVRRRYEAIGGRSPLLSICQEVAKKLEARLGVRVRLAMRLWKPYPKEVLAELMDEGTTRVVVVPLAQHSAHVYAESVESAAKTLASEGRPLVTLLAAKNWGQTPLLTRAFAAEVRRSLGELAEPVRNKTLLLFTAHSLPIAAVRAGDPYEKEVLASALAIATELGSAAPPYAVAFQSQGMGGGEWLGPDLPSALDAARAAGHGHVLVAPIGFLADHVEVLYDLDIEAQGLAGDRGLTLSRTRSLNDSPALIDALLEVTRPLLA